MVLGLGIISTVAIVAMLAARYRFGLSGIWRWVWSIGLMLSFYFAATSVPAAEQGP